MVLDVDADAIMMEALAVGGLLSFYSAVAVMALVETTAVQAVAEMIAAVLSGLFLSSAVVVEMASAN
ncbi:hypothetical protein [Anaerosporobacter faecicola]|uniref:hypothetical protein n=1 Tax=Anaerosporobacter faecicola TaxID=2718714 RepID=UPI001A9BE909